MMGKKGSTHGIEGVVEVEELIQAQINHLFFSTVASFHLLNLQLELMQVGTKFYPI
jgi:hypothetical protein